MTAKKRTALFSFLGGELIASQYYLHSLTFADIFGHPLSATTSRYRADYDFWLTEFGLVAGVDDVA